MVHHGLIHYNKDLLGAYYLFGKHSSSMGLRDCTDRCSSYLAAVSQVPIHLLHSACNAGWERCKRLCPSSWHSLLSPAVALAGDWKPGGERRDLLLPYC